MDLNSIPHAAEESHFNSLWVEERWFNMSQSHSTDFIQVIRGWDEGVAQMSLGERARLECSPDYAYGAAGAGGMDHRNG